MIRTLRRLTVLTAALLTLTTGAVITAGPASAEMSTGPIILHADEHLEVPRAMLYMQYDGNLVLYKDNRAVWDTGTWGVGPQGLHGVPERRQPRRLHQQLCPVEFRNRW